MNLLNPFQFFQHHLKLITCTAILFVGIVGVFLTLSICTALIPRSTIADNVTRSASILETESLYPVSFCNQYSSLSLLVRDQYTDCLMLNLAVSQDETSPTLSAITSPCLKDDSGYEGMPNNLRRLANESAKPNQHYDWYWHGYLVVLKPLLVFFDYGQIRWFNCILMLVLVVGALVLIARRLGRAEMLLLLAALLMMHFEAVPYTMQYASVFFVTFVAIVVMLSFPQWFAKHKRDYLMFFSIGAVTVFVDFLTTPVVTLGLPLLIWILYKDQPQKIRQVVFFSLMWGIGYALVWMSKWTICAMTYDPTVLTNAAEHADKWGGNDVEIGRMGMTIAIIKKYIGLLWSMNWIWGIVCMGVLLWLKPLVKHFGREHTWMLLVAAIPFAWSLVLVNHNNAHFGFTWRLVLVALYAVMLWVYHVIDWNRISNN